jgi:hypothetical protein
VNPALLDHPLLGELRGLVAKLSLISHAPIGAYGRQTRGSGEDIGGKPPRGGEVDRPRKPSKDASADDWEAYHEEHAAWKVSYQRHTPSYFAAELERCETEARLVELRDEAEASLKAWRRGPMPVGQEPLSCADPNWKRWVGETSLSAGEIARKFDVSRQYVWRIKRAYDKRMAA